MSNEKFLSESIEEYLEILYKLDKRGDRVTTKLISEELGVSPSSVTGMLKKLDNMGYVDYTPYRGVRLTAEGLRVSEKITRKHRLLEKFLCDILRIKKEKVHDEACDMEHSLSDDAERALCQVLNYPDKCPDDSEPIPACDFKFSSCEECLNRKEEEVNQVGKRNENLIPVMELKKRQKGKVSFIRGDYNVIRRLLDMGITIGAVINLVKVAPLSGPVEVAIRGSKLAIGRDIACNVFVEVIKDDAAAKS